MENKQIGFELTIFNALEEMDRDDVFLLREAERARHHSYSPYSKFSVGAALLLENGKIVLGSNQENASFPAGLCAEGVALFAAAANYPEAKIHTVAITAASEGHTVTSPIAPCGICRQSIAEYEKKQKRAIRIIMKGQSGSIYLCNSISDLLPLAFDNSFL